MVLRYSDKDALAMIKISRVKVLTIERSFFFLLTNERDAKIE